MTFLAIGALVALAGSRLPRCREYPFEHRAKLERLATRSMKLVALCRAVPSAMRALGKRIFD